MIGIPQLALVAVAISLDTFAAGIGLGTRTRRREWLKIAVFFAVSGGFFPIFGMWIGAVATGIMAQVAEVVGIFVLAGLGIWFLVGAWRSPDPTPGHLGGWLIHRAPGAPLDPARDVPSRRPLERDPGGAPMGDTGTSPAPPSQRLTAGPLLALSLGLSADNLLVGLGLGLYAGANFVLGAFVAIAVFLSTLAGLTLGRLKVQWFGRSAEAIAGLLILGLALFFLVTRGS